LPAIGTALGVAAIGYGCYQLAVYASNQIDVDDQLETGIKEQRESTPVELDGQLFFSCIVKQPSSMLIPFDH
jgi:hypothetical protein